MDVNFFSKASDVVVELSDSIDALSHYSQNTILNSHIIENSTMLTKTIIHISIERNIILIRTWLCTQFVNLSLFLAKFSIQPYTFGINFAYVTDQFGGNSWVKTVRTSSIHLIIGPTRKEIIIYHFYINCENINFRYISCDIVAYTWHIWQLGTYDYWILFIHADYRLHRIASHHIVLLISLYQTKRIILSSYWHSLKHRDHRLKE